jgi:hypothetical protein
MDPIQKEFERSVGDRFIEWLNTETGSEYYFADRPDRAPDLLYSSNGVELLVEITTTYYDNAHAAFLWKGFRGAKDAPDGWTGVDPNKSLAAAISDRIAKKSKKRYGDNTVLLIEVPPGVTSAEDLGDNTVLLIEVPPGVTSAEDLASLLREQLVKCETPFVGIYVVGRFPITPRSSGGYRVIPIKEL